jgi:[DsrC]-trisulfide reductase subunit M
MNALISLIAVVVLLLVAFFGVAAGNLEYLFGVIIPYLALVAFIGGVIARIFKWSRAPVPFHIPTTCGQQKSLGWIKHDKFDSPYTKGQVLVRMAMEVLFFRSLFRNHQSAVTGDDKHVSYAPAKLLWLFGILFHYTFLLILVRHLRFFTEPVPFFVPLIQAVDGFFQMATPTFYLSSLIFLAALGFLLFRRFANPQVRYISHVSDYFPLFLIIAIGLTGIWMRYFSKVDIVAAKELTMGLSTFSPGLPEGGIGAIFYAHLFLVCVLFAYFPFSKLMHAGGVFMSPTRNLANNSRAVRHVNPWDYPVKVHTYEEYEDDFRERMIKAGIPVDKEE